MYDVEETFRSHALNENQLYRYNQLKKKCKTLAEDILELSYTSREQSLALTKLEECSFWLSAAISREKETK